MPPSRHACPSSRRSSSATPRRGFISAEDLGDHFRVPVGASTRKNLQVVASAGDGSKRSSFHSETSDQRRASLGPPPGEARALGRARPVSTRNQPKFSAGNSPKRASNANDTTRLTDHRGCPVSEGTSELGSRRSHRDVRVPDSYTRVGFRRTRPPPAAIPVRPVDKPPERS